MKAPYIFNIQKFSTHDGPGIRTTVFFKGCPFRCSWCHNPESQCYDQEQILTKEKRFESVGKTYTISELVRELEKDQIFYEQSGGGVTLSGGEVMAQDINYIHELVARLNAIGISVIIDTSGEAPYESFKRILSHVDGFLYDIKFMDSKLHEKYVGMSNKRVLDNLKKLSEDGAVIYLRLIQIEGLNNSEAQMAEIVTWIEANQIRIESINLLPYHEFGSDKYARLNRESQIFKRPSEETLNKTCDFFKTKGYSVSIGG